MATLEQISRWSVARVDAQAERSSAAVDDGAATARSAQLFALALAGMTQWSGSAHRAASERVQLWAMAATGLVEVIREIAAMVRSAAASYVEAIGLAVRAYSVADHAGVLLRSDGTVHDPYAALPAAAVLAPDLAARQAATAVAAAEARFLAEQAVEAAHRGDLDVRAAAAAGERLAILRRSGSDFGVLAGSLRLGPFGLGPPAHGPPAVAMPAVPIPSGRPAGEVAAWFAGLPADQQVQLACTRPGQLGGLDGIPAWARDLANRQLLARELADLGEQPGPAPGVLIQTGRLEPLRAFLDAVVAALERIDASGRPAQLLGFDAERRLVAVSVGDADTADHLALLVPGAAVEPVADLADWTGNALALDARARAVTPAGEDVAVVAWLGYAAPPFVVAGVPPAVTGLIWTGRDSTQAAAALAGTVHGLAVAGRGQPPRITVVAHSYGTVLTSTAAQLGPLGADAVVLLGSPGVIGTGEDLGTPAGEVYAGNGAADPIGVVDLYSLTAPGGPTSSPLHPDYGAVPIAVDDPDHPAGHGDYFSAGSLSLRNVALVVAGQGDRVETAPAPPLPGALRTVLDWLTSGFGPAADG